MTEKEGRCVLSTCLKNMDIHGCAIYEDTDSVFINYDINYDGREDGDEDDDGEGEDIKFIISQVRDNVTREEAIAVYYRNDGSVYNSIVELCKPSEDEDGEDEDIKFILSQVGDNVTREEAIAAYHRNDDDMVNTILELCRESEDEDEKEEYGVDISYKPDGTPDMEDVD